MKKKLISLFLVAVMLCAMPVLPVSAEEAPMETAVHVMDFERCAVTNGFQTELTADKLGSPVYLGNHELMLTQAESIHGISARIHSCDMRWWSLNSVEDFYKVYLSVKVFESDNIDLQYAITTQDAQTANEGLGGRIISISKSSDGKAFLYDRDFNPVAELEYGKTYDIVLQLKRMSDTYTIAVNGDVIKEDAVYCSAICQINAARLHVSNSDIIIDDYALTTYGKTYAQTYSVQPTGTLPDFDYPAHYVIGDGYRVFHNTVELTLQEGEALAADDTFYLDAAKIIPELDPDVAYADGKITYDGETVDISEKLTDKNGRAMLSLGAINEIFGAKVWLDKAEHMVFLTTGSQIDDGFLRACGYKFIMNGEPYYEISFDKYDLSVQLMEDYFFGGNNLADIEKSLQTLHENGFKSIRVFINNPWSPHYDTLYDESVKAKYYECMDALYDLCDKYEIKVVASLQLDADLFLAVEKIDGSYVRIGEINAELIADRTTASRQVVYKYLDEYINHYKDRNTILMWEITNEANLDADVGPAISRVMASAIQVGEFFKDITEYINRIDPNHLVDSGDAGMRGHNYNLLLDTLNGRPCQWIRDTLEEEYKVMYIFNHGINVVSGHISEASDDYLASLMDISRSFDKPYYMGEATATGGYSMLDSQALQYQKEYLARIVESGVQLIHWWDFDAPLSNEEYKVAWNVTLETCPDTFYAIKDANLALQEKYMVNGVSGADQYTPKTSLLGGKYSKVVSGQANALDNDSVSAEDTDDQNQEAAGLGTGAVIGIVVAVVAVVILAVVAVIARKKK